MKDVIIIFVILLVLLMLISTFGGSLRLPPNEILMEPPKNIKESISSVSTEVTDNSKNAPSLPPQSPPSNVKVSIPQQPLPKSAPMKHAEEPCFDSEFGILGFDDSIVYCEFEPLL